MPNFWTQASYAAANGQLLVSGGYYLSPVGIPSIAHTAAYNPVTNSWSTLPDGQFPTTVAAGSCGFYKLGAINSDGVFTAQSEMLTGFNVCGAATIPWMSESATTATLRPGKSITVTVSLAATAAGQITKPGTYTAQIGIEQNTPYVVNPENVTMNVTA